MSEIEQRIEDILEGWIDIALTSSLQAIDINGYKGSEFEIEARREADYQNALSEARTALTDLVTETKIEELERLHRYQGEGLPKRDYDNETDELIDERIKELTASRSSQDGKNNGHELE